MNFEELINKHGREYLTLCPNLPNSEYGELESMFLYCFVREFKPKNVAEVGTEFKGRSSYIIQSAMEGGTHRMFDIPATVGPAAHHVRGIGSAEIVIYSGYFENTASDVNWGEVDFLFIDADHTRKFASFYLDNVIAHLRPGTWVHIHDMNFSGNWKLRDLGDNEGTEFLSVKDLPLHPELWLWDYCISPDKKDTWNKIKEDFPFIGEWPAYELPTGCSATYWRKI